MKRKINNRIKFDMPAISNPVMKWNTPKKATHINPTKREIVWNRNFR